VFRAQEGGREKERERAPEKSRRHHFYLPQGGFWRLRSAA
jgi:hypothetical protein